MRRGIVSLSKVYLKLNKMRPGYQVFFLASEPVTQS